jgi:hypothetical protein
MIIQAVGLAWRADHLNFLDRKQGVDMQQVEQLSGRILQALAQGPLTRPELHQAVPELDGIEGAGWGHDVRYLAYGGYLVLAGRAGAETRFAHRDLWLPASSGDLLSPEKALEELLLRYLAGYGPATMQDFAYWTGLRLKTVQTAFQSCRSCLLPVRVNGWPGEYYLRQEDELALMGSLPEPPAVALLPKFDTLLLGFKNKGRFMDSLHYKLVFRAAGQVEAVVLLSGWVAGAWRSSLRGKKLRLTVEPFRKFGKDEIASLEEKASSLASFLGAQGVEVVLLESQ